MKLRKARKAPKRYDDYEWEEEDHEPVCTTTQTFKTSSQQTICIRPQIPAYNPNLRPAAFPTLDCRVPCKGSPTSVGSLHGGGPQPVLLNTKVRSQINRFKTHQLEGQTIQKPNISIPPLYENTSEIQTGSMQDCLIKVTAQRLQAEINWEYSDDGSEVFARNLETLERMDKRSDDDWNIVEMMTSDEEDTSTVGSGQLNTTFNASPLGGSCAPTGQPTCTPTAIASATWDELTVAHQLDLVHVLSERYDSIKEAMKRLRLNFHQNQRMLKLLEQRGKPEHNELRRGAKLQAEASRFLLARDTYDDEFKSRAAMESRYIPRVHCYQVDVEKFTFSNPRELAKAKAYLESCGGKPALLNHWEYLFYDFGKKGDEKGQMSVSSLSPAHELDSVRYISILEPGKLQSHGTLTPNSRLPLRPEPFDRTYLSSDTHPSPTTVRHPGSVPTSAPRGHMSSHTATLAHSPRAFTSSPPITFLYPISPTSSPPPFKTVKLDGRNIARHSYPITGRPSAVQSSRKASAASREDSRLPAANIQPNDTTSRRLRGGIARKKKQLTGERKSTTTSGSYLSTGTPTSNKVAPTIPDFPRRMPIPIAPMVSTERATASAHETSR